MTSLSHVSYFYGYNYGFSFLQAQSSSLSMRGRKNKSAVIKNWRHNGPPRSDFHRTDRRDTERELHIVSITVETQV